MAVDGPLRASSQEPGGARVRQRAAAWMTAAGLLTGVAAFAATPSPRLSGMLDVDIATGVLHADLCLDQLPDGVHGFELHRGLNLRHVRAKDSSALLDFDIDPATEVAGDATRYRLDAVAPAAGVCMEYVGAYPVYQVAQGERAADDWKGVIAFDGSSVRAADQSRFVPAPVAPDGTALPAVRIAVRVRCDACTTIYWNGLQPAEGPVAALSSDVARPPLLYAGTFEATTVGAAHFVGVPVLGSDAAVISAGVRRIAALHAALLGIEYGDAPSFLSFASLSRQRSLQATSWQFVTWPTIASDGLLPFASFVTGPPGARGLGPEIEKLLSHEMAHYYFGTLFRPSGPLQWFLLESTAEFLSLKALKTLRGEAAWEARIDAYGKDVAARSQTVALDRVTDPAQIDEGYRYRLGPLLWTGLEHWLGEAAVRVALGQLVRDAPTGAVAYAQLRARLVAAGAGEEDLRRFEQACLQAGQPGPGCWGR